MSGKCLSPPERSAVGAGSRLESKSPQDVAASRVEHLFGSGDAIESLSQVPEALKMGVDEAFNVGRDGVHGTFGERVSWRFRLDYGNARIVEVGGNAV